jgi:hypothetical protein
MADFDLAATIGEANLSVQYVSTLVSRREIRYISPKMPRIIRICPEPYLVARSEISMKFGLGRGKKVTR